jgi:hypothetical protein
MNTIRVSRVGLVVIKLCAQGAPYYLMRLNQKWKDVNFIGGHEKPRDVGNLAKTARRELWEEVPSIRSDVKFHLEPLTREVHHGPIVSKSKGINVEYQLQFFLLKIDSSPESLVEMISVRSKNVWVTEDELISQTRFRVSGLVAVLHHLLPVGLTSIPYSFPADLTSIHRRFRQVSSEQLELALK